MVGYFEQGNSPIIGDAASPNSFLARVTDPPDNKRRGTAGRYPNHNVLSVGPKIVKSFDGAVRIIFCILDGSCGRRRTAGYDRDKAGWVDSESGRHFGRIRSRDPATCA